MNSPMNMIAQSQSGTGKTAAFSLTMLSRISYDLQQPQVTDLRSAEEYSVTYLLSNFRQSASHHLEN